MRRALRLNYNVILEKIEQIDDYKFKFSSFCNGGRYSIFRGQCNSSWELKSTLQRVIGKSLTKEECWSMYLDYFDRFKRVAIEGGYDKLKLESQNEDFFYMSMARHLGFPSHFIDWSSSFETAIEMACNNSDEFQDCDGIIYVMSFPKIKHTKSTSKIDIWKETILICKDFDLVFPDIRIQNLPLGRLRRFRQNGYFSIINPNDFDKPILDLLSTNGISCYKIIIPKGEKLLFKQFLSSLRIDNYYGLDIYNKEGKIQSTDVKLLNIIADFNDSIKSITI
ncbi:MAG: FRG domain-containing protein [Muribaculaceae bacterium]|nr:FRG domain-containing protein [Muribaculaceae bacterium]